MRFFLQHRVLVSVATCAVFCAQLFAPIPALAREQSELVEARQQALRELAGGRQAIEMPSQSPDGGLHVDQQLRAGDRSLAARNDTEISAHEPKLEQAETSGIEGEAADREAPELDLKALPTGDDKSGVTSKAISMPKGAGTLEGMGESFSAQISTGGASYSVPFALPKARGQVSAQAGLGYSSSGGHGNAGVGWNMNPAFIARQTDRGVPGYDDRSTWHANQDRFVFNGGQELVPICDIGVGLECEGVLAGEVMPSWSAGWQYHRSRVEGGFVRFFWSPDRRTWRAQGKDGATLELGVPLDGSSYGGGLEQNPSRPGEIYRWYITREYDAQTATGEDGGAPVNFILYKYLSHGNARYLSDIYDTSPAEAPTTSALERFAHHTRLVWEERADRTHSYRSGWRIEQGLRLARVDVSAAEFGNEGRVFLRRYQLKYAGLYHVSLLESVQLLGRCSGGGGANPPPTLIEDAQGGFPALVGCSLLEAPPMRFEYSHVGPVASDGFEPFDAQVRSLGGSPPHALDEALTDLFDVNADGLPDVLVTAPGVYAGNFGWFQNSAGGQFESFGGARGVRVRGVAGANTNTLQLTNINLTALDVDGDGVSNLLHMPRTNQYGVYEFVPVGQEYELRGRVVQAVNGQSPKIDFTQNAQNTQVMDVNFDGLVDVVVTTGTAVQTFFGLGRLPGGYGQFGTGAYASASSASLHLEPEERCVPHSGLPIQFSDPEVRVADMNGDGIGDIVRLRSGAVHYWPGRGNGFWGTGERDDCPSGSFASGRSVEMMSPPVFWGEAVRLDDVNGDGLTDIVNIRNNSVDIWLNKNGEGFTPRRIIENTPFAPDFRNRVRLVDVDGSGTRDILWGDAHQYKYIDLQGGTRPWVLTGVDNGLGKITELEYATSVDEMLSAERAGEPWARTMPLVVPVVKRKIERDQLNVGGQGERIYVTEYSYRDPVYDGRQREFRGFAEATTATLGDGNSPTSFSRSSFLLGDCFYDTGEPCEKSDITFDNPHEALKGLPLVSESYNEQGVYVSTSVNSYTLKRLYTGLDLRGVMFAAQTSGTQFLYDTSNPSAFNSNSEVVLASVQVEGNGAGPELETRVILRATAGTAKLKGSAEIDSFGNQLVKRSEGCVSGCPSGAPDEVISEVQEFALLPHSSGWMWRPIRGYAVGSVHTTRRNETLTSFNALGMPELVTSVLSGTEVLNRFHEASGPVAPAPADAVSDSNSLFVSEFEYDLFGNPIRVLEPAGRCSDVFFDELYTQLPITEMIYPSGCPVERSLSGAPADALYTAAAYDRGLGVITYGIDVSFQINQLEYDALGRLVRVFRSEPDSAGIGSLPAVEVEYDLARPGRPYSIIHTKTLDGASTASSAVHESYLLQDGFGRALATLQEADPNALDDGQWIVDSLLAYDSKGAVSRKYMPYFWDGEPLGFNVAQAIVTKYGRVEYDAFGRELNLYDLDGTQTMRKVYRPLALDSWDAADMEPGGAHYGTFLTEISDGHGRGTLSVERFKEGSNLIERRSHTAFLPTGEPLSLTRSSVHGSTTRWLRYDSLGRMVLNVEPHTSVGFNPDPSADASGILAWRYAYNANGELVGTSDARGCGVNYAYDGVGRLVYEDYSPCGNNHAAYSAPSFSGSAPSGVEVYYHYDTQPPVALGEPEVPKGSLSHEFEVFDSGQFLRGKLVAVFDRAKTTWTNYDGRGRGFEVWVRVAPPGAPNDALASRYTGRWYQKAVQFDAMDRIVRETTGARSPELMGANGESHVDSIYSERGTLKEVAGAYGVLVNSIRREADGQNTQVVYGDLARTTTRFEYDERRRLSSVQTYRGPPASWSSPPPGYSLPLSTHQTTFQRVLQHDRFEYDVVGNPLIVHDFREPDEWPAGAKPVSRRMQYDDLYRVKQVEYDYSDGDSWLPVEHSLPVAGHGLKENGLAKPEQGPPHSQGLKLRKGLSIPASQEGLKQGSVKTGGLGGQLGPQALAQALSSTPRIELGDAAPRTGKAPPRPELSPTSGRLQLASVQALKEASEATGASFTASSSISGGLADAASKKPQGNRLPGAGLNQPSFQQIFDARRLGMSFEPKPKAGIGGPLQVFNNVLPEPLAPSGVNSASPSEFEFSPHPAAIGYEVSLVDATGAYSTQLVSPSVAGCPGNSGVCTVSAWYTLPAGAASWGVRAELSGGWEPYQQLEFSIGPVTALGVPTLTSPNSAVNAPLDIEWEQAAGAYGYGLSISDENEVEVFYQEYLRPSLGCQALMSACGVSGLYLPEGKEYGWKVRALNAHGQVGNYSSALAFEVLVSAINQAIELSSPEGDTPTTLPIYRWQPLPNATGYELKVDLPQRNIFSLTLSAEDAGCADGVSACEYLALEPLAAGHYQGWVRGTNSLGAGPWAQWPSQFKVQYAEANTDDDWSDPFANHLADPRRAEPSPYQAFDQRIREQSWSYDWLGNTIETGDDQAGFYDRSLGAIENGPLGGKAYQLLGASNVASGSSRKGSLRAEYDVLGQLTELRVDRDGACVPIGKCSQLYRYGWDEVGRLVKAERWDYGDLDVELAEEPTSAPAVELHYAYDASDMRVLKRAVDPEGEESHTVYLFGGLELRRTHYSEVETDYTLNEYTEVAYLFANGMRLARLVYEAPNDVPSIEGETLHVFFELGDHLGSTSVVLDKATGELVERSSYQAYGGSESDYRPARWKEFRADYRFTGKEEDIEVGLVYFGKRYLNPLLNRWVSADPLTIHGLGADPNLYAYVSGRVLQSVDPLGLEEIKVYNVNTVPFGDGKGDSRMVGFMWFWTTSSGTRFVGNEAELMELAKNHGVKRVFRYDPSADWSFEQTDSYIAMMGTVESNKKVLAEGGEDIFKDLVIAGAILQGEDGNSAPGGNKRGLPGGGNPEGVSGKGLQTLYFLNSISFVVFGAAGAGTKFLAKKATKKILKKYATAKLAKACFIVGTLVLSPNGYIPIEDIREGDWVLSQPEGGDESGEPAWREVEEVFEHVGEPYDLYAEAADGVQVHFGVTGEHPFWVGGRGWVEVQAIQPADRLWSLERGWLWVRSVHERHAQEPVYNLRVAEDRTYFVGESAVWVHNKGGGLGRLRSVGPSTWESSGGLVYGTDKVFGNRVQHVLAHTTPDATKPMHSLFNVGRNQVLGLVDEAWLMRGAAVTGDPGAFIVPMGRVVGTSGETAVRIVVRPGTNQIITAYPVMP